MELVVKTDLLSVGEAPILLRSKNYNQLLLDLSSVSFVKSLELTQWKCLIELALEYDMKVNITPPHEESAYHYAGRMGLFEKTNYVYPFKEKQPQTFFPLLRIESDRNENLYEECLRVFSMSNVSTNYIRRLADTFTELADNVYFHSGQSPNSGWGYVHAQVYQKNICIGVSDVGVGFYGSYKQNNQIRGRTEKQILLDAFKVGESSLNPFPKPGYRGVGLSEVFEFIERFSGIMTVSSGKAMVMATQKGLKDEGLLYNVYGAWIQLEVPIL